MFSADWGTARRAVAEAVEQATTSQVAARIWRRDPTLWSGDPDVQSKIANRLGWLDAPSWARDRIAEMRSFAEDVRGFDHVLLLGMGGSSLAPEVLSRTYGYAGHPKKLIALDSTDPSEILAAEAAIDVRKTLFFVASKSGETIETRSHAAYFLERSGDPSHFVAITDPGSPLETTARERGFRHVFLNPPDIGGRYSALSYFGLVPAAAIGIDPAPLIERARECAEALQDRSTNPGLELGAGLAELAGLGRDKVTFLPEDAFESFGGWAEQLLAESTGKEAKGVIPVDGEPEGKPDVYADDRVFVRLLEAPATHGDVLVEAGHPSIGMAVGAPADLGRLFFLWEFATAVAGWRLGINPFDEPNVAESKANTARLIEIFRDEGALPAEEPAAVEHGVAFYGRAGGSVAEALNGFLAQAQAGDYLALQAFLPRVEETDRALREMRVQIRNRLRIATTLGFGPRYLHSTGQLHKGGANTGLFLQITTEHPRDVSIPGAPYSFGVLQAAQAAGDLESLRQHGRRAVRVHLADGVEAGLAALGDLIRRVT